VVVCCAGFFRGLIPLLGLNELLRIAKKGGLIVWNVAVDDDPQGDFATHDAFVTSLVNSGKWKHFIPSVDAEDVAFTDSGAAMLAGYTSCGAVGKGRIYVMQKM